MLAHLLRKQLRSALAQRLRLFVDLYLSCLAIVKMPLLGAMDYLVYKWGPEGEPSGVVYIRLTRQITLQLRRNKTDIKIFEQIFLYEDCKVRAKDFQPKLIIDGGAHVGCASVYYALHYPDARIVAVEAELSNFKKLCENTKSLPKIEAIHAAICGKQGTAVIENPLADAWEFRIRASNARVDAVENCIPVITMLTLMERFGMTSIDLLKLDIEGAEMDVFTCGAKHWLSAVKVIVIELHDRIRPGCTEAFRRAVARYPCMNYETVQNIVWVRH